jgi:hypothetical protein
LQALEAALGNRRTRRVPEIQAKMHYANDNAREDDDMELFPVTVTGFADEWSQANSNLRGSGFRIVKTVSQGSEDCVSPWEIIIEEGPPPRPELASEEKAEIMKVVDTQLRNEAIRDHFSQSINRDRYSDYDKMVEVEMYLMKIKRRVQENYYATKMSAVADIQLIRDNCVKYNGMANELAQISCQMYNDVRGQLLSDEESSMMITTETEFRAASSTPAGQPGVRPIRLRLRNSAASSVPGPVDGGEEPQESLPQHGRRSLRSGFETADNNVQDGAPDVDEVAQEPSSRTSRGQERTRSIQESDSDGDEAPSDSEPEDSDDEIVRPSRNSRKRRRSSTDDQEDETERSSRRPTRARRTISAPEQESGRRTRRGGRNQVTSYQDPDSDEFDPEDEEEPESSSSEEEPDSPSRRTRTTHTSYAELPSDYDEEDFEDDEQPVKKKRSASTSPRAKRKRDQSKSFVIISYLFMFWFALENELI